MYDIILSSLLDKIIMSVTVNYLDNEILILFVPRGSLL